MLKILCIIILSTNYFLSGAYPQEIEPPLSYYEIIEKRNFFKPIREEISAALTQDTDLVDNKGLETKHLKALLKPDDLTLTGIIKLGDQYKAIIEKPGANQGFYVGINDAVQDYLVSYISEDSVTLEKNGQEFILGLQTVAGRDEFKLQPEPEVPNLAPDADSNSTKLQSGLNIIQRLRTGGR